MKTAVAPQRVTGFPILNGEIEDVATRPMAMHELPVPFRIDHELNIIEHHHARIANSIRMFWGHRDCVEYIQKLIMSGGDGAAEKRVGFKPAVLTSLMTLVSLHNIILPAQPLV